MKETKKVVSMKNIVEEETYFYFDEIKHHREIDI